VLALRRTLVDLRGANLRFTGKELSSLVSHVVIPVLKGRDWKTAIVVEQPIQFGVSRQYHVFAEQYSTDCIFHDDDEALLWLHQQGGADRTGVVAEGPMPAADPGVAPDRPRSQVFDSASCSGGGRRPRSCGRTRYDGLYIYGFARPATGQTGTALLPRVNAERRGDALAAFAARADPEGRKVLVVLRDHGGWQVAKRLAVPANVVLHFLPPCTPELQPAEPPWPLVREAVANRSIGRIDRLRAVLRGRLAILARNPAVVQPVVGFRWAARLEQEGINLIR
jgi:hypothetical protein